MAAASTQGIEQEILAGIMTRGERYHDAARLLTAEKFNDPKHQMIWRAMGNMVSAGEPLDALSVSQHLIDQGKGALIGNGAYLTGLVADIVGVDPSHHVERLHKLYVQRQARNVGARLAESDGSPEAVDEALRELLGLQQGTTNHEHHIQDLLREATDQLHEAMEKKGELVGITTGLKKLDEHLGGLHPSDLTVIGARPAMGKTSLLLNMAYAALKSGKRAGGTVSSEQPGIQIAQRHQSSIAKVALHAMRAGRISREESERIIRATTHLAKLNYWVFDRSQPTIDEVIRIARGWHHRHGIDILWLDYIQRIKGHGSSKVDEIESVCAGLKTLARDLEIPVVALAQVNREVESRPNKRPRMSDLKGSGAIEQEADTILTLYRDEVYDEDSPDKGIAEISIEKARHGYTGIVRASWAGEFLTFGDLDAEYLYGGHH
jgi:replicative DNA helicase